MKLKDFITKLQTFDPELEVCLADWSENYALPSSEAVKFIKVNTRKYYDGNWDSAKGAFLQIGDDGTI